MTPTVAGIVLIATLATLLITTRHRWTRYRKFVIVLLLAEIAGLTVVFVQLSTHPRRNWAGNLVASGTRRAWNVNLAITSQKPISSISVQWTVPKGLPLPHPITETFGKNSGLMRWQHQWSENIPASLSHVVASRKLSQVRIHVSFVSSNGRHQTTYSIFHLPPKNAHQQSS